jgi:hypothetical protein
MATNPVSSKDQTAAHAAAEPKKSALARLTRETKIKGNELYRVAHEKDYSLGYKTDELIYNVNTAQAKREAELVRNAYLALDQSLTALGYKRDKFERAGVADRGQISWGWLDSRLFRFMKDQGLIAENEPQQSIIFGKNGLTKLMGALKK